MRKKLITATILSAAMLAACGNNQNASEDRDIYKESGNTVNRQDREELYNPSKVSTNQEKSREFGYVRQVKSPTPNTDIKIKHIYTPNREKMADAISKLSVTIPKVHDAAVLVTDEEVLIAYRTDTKDKKERFDVADQVKKTAMSATPRWYHVYVTDDPGLRQDVENISFMDATSANKETVIKSTIKDMLSRSPQGRKINNENENGEIINDIGNKAEDSDEYHEQFDKGNL